MDAQPFRSNKDDKLIHELMPILIGIGPDGDLHCYGSCFIVQPHLAITASHVLKEFLKRDPAIIEGRPPAFEYWIVQVIWEGDKHNLVVWTIDSVGTCGFSDIGIIWFRALGQTAVKYQKERKWKGIGMTFDPPRVGDRVTAFGIHGVSFEGSRVNGEGKFENVAVDCHRSVSTGVVSQLFWGGRDRGLYNFPCFEVDAKFDHGMSGGLVINDRSQACGIICGSLPPAVEGERHVSYVTMLWPMLTIPVAKHLIEGGVGSQTYTLRDLSLRGTFNPSGWDRVIYTTDTNGTPGIQFASIAQK